MYRNSVQVPGRHEFHSIPAVSVYLFFFLFSVSLYRRAVPPLTPQSLRLITRRPSFFCPAAWIVAAALGVQMGSRFLLGYFLCFFLGMFYGFLGLDCREPVRVSQRGLIWVFSGYVLWFSGPGL